MLYHAYEMTHAAISPLRVAAHTSASLLRHPLNPLSYTLPGRAMAAAGDVFEAVTRRYGKPGFDLPETIVEGEPVPVREAVVWERTFCKLLRFHRDDELMMHIKGVDHKDPKVLIVAPMSGHYATLLRGTVEAMIPEHDVYITDWTDAREVPVYDGHFDLNDFVDYLIEMIRFLGPSTHVMAVCQPGPAALAAASLMAEARDPAAPASLTIMGSPIDPRESPTVPNKLSMERPFDWFKKNMIMTVPWPHTGVLRRVYPGFIQLTSFMSMNSERHVSAHKDLFVNLIKGDGDSVEKHHDFYEEYLSVMDITAEFYLQTIDEVFQRHLLPKGEFYHRGQRVKPEAITDMALMTVEGEKDDISGIGQTQAAHTLCPNIPQEMQLDYIQPDVGHYGVFNGRRWRTEIQPRIRDFIRAHDKS